MNAPNSFRGMMELLMDEDFAFLDVELPGGFEKAGIVTPTSLMRMARNPQDQEVGLRLTVIGRLFELVDDHVQKHIIEDEKMMAYAEQFIGQQIQGEDVPLQPEDLILVRFTWRAVMVGTTLTTSGFHTIEPAPKFDETTQRWVIRWPYKRDEEAQFWPVRHLRAAYKFALFTRGMRNATGGAINPPKS